MMSAPVREDKPLKAQFISQELIQGVRIGTTVAVVDLIVGAHDASGARSDRVRKRPNDLSARNS